VRLASRIRSERESRGWSVADLAQRSSVSRAMIAKIEKGQSSPTAMLLGRLSGALGVTMSALLARAEAGEFARLNRQAEQAVWRDPGSGYLRRQVFPVPGSSVPVDLIEVELPVGAVVAFPASSYAFIRQLIWVLAGELIFFEGEAAHHLRRGDGLELGPPCDCRFENRSRAVCRYAVVIHR
jgi:transcriptional regulator with XRE-family HTH domain